MKNLFYLIPVLFFSLLACEKEDPVQGDIIASITMFESSSIKEAKEIKVKIQKDDPCEFVNEIVKTVSGKTFNYDFILQGDENHCITIYSLQEDVSVVFDPTITGQHTINFLINGRLFETRTVSVTEESFEKDIEGKWTVVSFEDYKTSTSITKTAENTWSDYNNGDITVKFSFTEKFFGKITGKNVTNTFEGDFTIGSDRKITTEHIHWTEMDEPEWARMFHHIVLAESYELNSKRMIIYYKNKEKGIVLEKSQ